MSTLCDSSTLHLDNRNSISIVFSTAKGGSNLTAKADKA